MKDYRDILLEEFEIRKTINKSYSKRSFAKDLEISSGQLSDILNYKKGISKERAFKIAETLGLSVKEREAFITLVESEHSRKKKDKFKAKSILKTMKQYKKLDEGIYNLISDWYYFGILAIMELDAFDGTTKFILDRINLEASIVQEALFQLEELNIIKQENNQYVSCESHLETETDFISMGRRKSHKQTLVKAIESIDTVEIAKRDITAITMAIDSSKLSEAKRKIAKFRKELADFLEEGKKDQVYNLNIQLFPLVEEK